MNWRISVAVIGLAVAACSSAVCGGEARHEPRGGASQAEQCLDVETSGGTRLRVQAFSDDVIRLWVEPTGSFTRAASLAVADPSRQPVAARIQDTGSQAILRTGSLCVRVNRNPLRIDVYAGDNRTPVATGIEFACDGGGGKWSLKQSLADGERLLGLGEDNRNNGRLDRRGTERELWAGQQINSGNVTSSYSIPFLVSTGRKGHAYGLFIDNGYRLRFDLGKTSSTELKCMADGGEIDLYVINGPRIASVIDRYTGLTGRPMLPPLWSLGYWQSKCAFWDFNEMDKVSAGLRERGFPCDVLVIDFQWSKVQMDHIFDPRWFGKDYTPADKLRQYAGMGYRTVLYSSPMVKSEASTYKSGLDAGVFATDGKGNPVTCGYYGGKLLDFTSPNMNAWLWPQLKPLMDMGVPGWWLDLTEPEGEPPQTVYHGGKSADIHNEYSLLCARSFRDAQLNHNPRQRPFILTRCGSAGIQRYNVSLWTGDVASDYATLRAHPPEMLNSGLSGVPWWTSDTGGFLEGFYKNDRYGAHGRLYERWMQFSAFAPITRAHKSGPCIPYDFGVPVEQGCRNYLKLRYRLLPYIYSYAYETWRSGMPLARPLLLEYPDDPRAADVKDAYLFGSELLVAPVLSENVSTRKVYLPKGKWIDWDYGYEYEGGREWVMSAPQNRIPVAVRAGAIIPMAPDMLYTTEKPWDPITLEVFPSGKSSFTMYYDDGVSDSYTSGDCTLTKITCDEKPDGVRLVIEESNKRYTPKNYIARLHLRRLPSTVALDGVAAKQVPSADKAVPGSWSWERERGAAVVTLSFAAGTSTRHTIHVQTHGPRLALPMPPVLQAEPDNMGDQTTRTVSAAHFYPPPRLPGRVEAENYDNGGEGAGFHVTRTGLLPDAYRADGIGLTPCTDTGAGMCLSGLQKDEWVRYTIDGGEGGYYDLSARVASAKGGQFRLLVGDQDVLATLEIPATGGDQVWKDLTVANLYLNPGQSVLLLQAAQSGLGLNYLDFRTAANPPNRYEAERGLTTGRVTRETGRQGYTGPGHTEGLGRKDSSLVLAVRSDADGTVPITLRYINNNEEPAILLIGSGDGPLTELSCPKTGEWVSWKDLTADVSLKKGINRLMIKAADGSNQSIVLDHVDVGKSLDGL